MSARPGYKGLSYQRLRAAVTRDAYSAELGRVACGEREEAWVWIADGSGPV